MNKKWSSLVLILFVGLISAQDSLEMQKEIAYIKRFAKIAVEEMHLYKIPASITLSQGLVETADGQSELAQNANNHFGIKCKKEWTGETYRYTDDAYKECFRKYKTPEESYRDHSKFLAERPYYKDLFKLDIKDYKGWAYGLKKAGYATNPRYAPIIIKKIEDHQLQRFDNLKTNEVEKKLKEWYSKDTTAIVTPPTEIIKPIKKDIEKDVVVNKDEKKTKSKPYPLKIEKKGTQHPLQRKKNHENNIPYVVIESGESLYKISKTYDVPVSKLMKYNDIEDETKVQAGQNIFLKYKRNKGPQKTYQVKSGDTMYSISQQFGIKLSKLYKRNRMEKGQEPKAGEWIYLRGKKKK